MSEHLLERTQDSSAQAYARRRQRPQFDDRLVLTELNPDDVVDHLEPQFAPVDLITFGTVRETCPRCEQPHLKLVLRQRRIRMAHLFCSECSGCFDAHYSNGASALTI